jgi:hypothetical protein
MRLQMAVAWNGQTDISAKLLGCYEAELHELLCEVRNKTYGKELKIANIGCAEGYYAVGLARMFPQSVVWAVDVDPGLVSIMLINAGVNEVPNIIAVNATGNEAGAAAAMDGADFVFMDCEGAEFDYLDLDKTPSLASATIIVELHNGMQRDKTVSLTETLVERFRATHKIDSVYEGGRNPNFYMMLQGWHSDIRWLAMSEGRPGLMNWLYMVPRE